MSSVAARLRAIVERDLKSLAAELLAQRKANREGPVCSSHHYTCINLINLFAAIYTLATIIHTKGLR